MNGNGLHAENSHANLHDVSKWQFPGNSADLSEQMRLILVNYEYPPLGGGAATATQALAGKLVELGHQITVLTAKFRDLPAENDENGASIVLILPSAETGSFQCPRDVYFHNLVSAVSAVDYVQPSPDGLIAFFHTFRSFGAARLFR